MNSPTKLKFVIASPLMYNQQFYQQFYPRYIFIIIYEPKVFPYYHPKDMASIKVHPLNYTLCEFWQICNYAYQPTTSHRILSASCAYTFLSQLLAFPVCQNAKRLELGNALLLSHSHLGSDALCAIWWLGGVFPFNTTYTTVIYGGFFVLMIKIKLLQTPAHGSLGK